MGGRHINAPVQSLVPDADGVGYWLGASDGGIFDFSGTPDGFKGSLGANPPALPITSVAVLEG